MAFNFRGRGRGRGGVGGGGGGFRIAKQVPFELFPEIEELGTAAGVKQDVSFALRYNRLQKYWNSSPYYIGDKSVSLKKTQSREIERFSDRKSGKEKSKALLSDFVRMEPDYVPADLAKGEKEKHGAKRVRWNPESDLQKLDVFEKLEQKHQGEDINEKNEDEEEEEDEKIEEEEEEYSDDGDYNQNIDFDDDEDDFNLGDDNDDEPIF